MTDAPTTTTTPAAKPPKTPKPAMAARTPKTPAAPKPPKAAAAPKPAKAAKPLSARAQVQAAAEKGKLPSPPDFSAETHKRFRGKLAELVALAKAGDVAALKAFAINPISTSPKALARYRDLCVIALEAKAAA